MRDGGTFIATLEPGIDTMVPQERIVKLETEVEQLKAAVQDNRIVGLRVCEWAVTGSNRRPPACKAGALPAELTAPTTQEYGRELNAVRRAFRSAKGRRRNRRAPASSPG
jgi:hypothetical protein